jgi:ornithine cyclodeaminase
MATGLLQARNLLNQNNLMSKVLLLNHSELEQCVPLDMSAIQCVEESFKILATESVIMPPIMQLDVRENNGEVCIKTAYLPGLDSFAIKISPGFFDNPKIGLPSGSGMMNVFNSKTGVLEAVLLDKGYLTDVRTAAAGAVAAKWLSRAESRCAAIIGAGVQALLQLKALLLVREIAQVTVWARDGERAVEFANKASRETGVVISVADTVNEACADADIIVTTTPSENPLVQFQDLHPGQHITAMGADSERKSELDPWIIAGADRYVCDRLSQVRALGDLHRAIQEGVIPADKNFDELGQVIAGQVPGRESDDQITICDLTGTGAQDTAIATHALKLAVDRGLGQLF